MKHQFSSSLSNINDRIKLSKESLKRWPLLTLTLFLFFNCKVNGQEFYAATDMGGISLIDPYNCTLNQVCNDGKDWYDIAMDDNGVMYGVDFYGLYTINLNNCKFKLIYTYPNIGKGVNSLVFVDGKLYSVSDVGEMFVYHIATGVMTHLGNIGHKSSGDLIYFEGELLLTTTSNQIIQIDPDNVANVKIIDTINQLDGINGEPWGFNTLPDNASVCGKMKIFISGDFGSLHEYNLPTKTATQVCPNLSMVIFGAASVWEGDSEAPVNLNIGKDTTLCTNNFTLELQPTGELDGFTFEWSNNSVNPSISISEPGEYWLEVRKNDCLVRDSIVVSTHPKPEVNLGPDISICSVGEKFKLETNNEVNGYKYLWNNLATSSTILVSEPGSYWLEINHNNCISSDTIELKLDPLPKVNLGPDTALCGKDQDLVLQPITPITGFDLQWSTLSKEPTISVAKTGEYWLEIKQKDCIARDTISIVFNSIPTLNLGRDTIACSEEVILLQSKIKNVEFNWNQGSSTSENYWASPGTTTLSIKDKNGCVNMDTILIETRPSLEFSLGNDTVLCFNENNRNIITINSDQLIGLNYQWNSSNTNPSVPFFIDQPGEYTLEVIDEYQCVFKDTLKITNLCDPTIFVPNAFTPNEDGQNDYWGLSSSFVTHYTILVFDRWGELIWEGDESNPYWNGYYKGRKAQIDLYVYKITYSSLKQKNKVLTGTVSLIR